LHWQNQPEARKIPRSEEQGNELVSLDFPEKISAWRINREQSYKSKQRKVSKIKGFRLLIRSRQEAETHFAPYLLPTDSSPGLCRKTGGESSSFPCRQLTESGL
jgi:hypothetical protein